MNQTLWILRRGGDRGSQSVPNVISHRVESDGTLVYAWQRDGVLQLDREDDWDEAARYVGEVRLVVARRTLTAV